MKSAANVKYQCVRLPYLRKWVVLAIASQQTAHSHAYTDSQRFRFTTENLSFLYLIDISVSEPISSNRCYYQYVFEINKIILILYGYIIGKVPYFSMPIIIIILLASCKILLIPITSFQSRTVC